MEQRYPFSVIASQGLGVSNSSLEKIGPLNSQEGFGAAKIKFFPNIATGNLVVKDRVLNIKELGGDIRLGFTYNSQAGSVDQCWHFSHQRFVQLDSNNPKAILQEADGHLTTYTFDQNTGFYFTPTGSNQGTPWLRYDESNQQWIQYHPGTNITEYYNLQGLLQKRIDLAGRVLSYEYDSQNNLKTIVGQSGSRYEIRRSDKTVEIYLTGGDLEDQLLQTYQFDEQNRLISSQTADGYKTTYHYGIGQDAWKLLNIQQSDQTQLKFTYDQNKKLSRFNLGAASNYTIQYIDHTHPKVMIKDAYFGQTHMGLDSNYNITDITRSQGFDSVLKTTDTTAYAYNNQQQLETITYPNGGQENFAYQDIYGVLKKHVLPNGQTSENNYQKDGDRIRLIGQIQYEGEAKKPLATCYVYDIAYQNNYKFLRFKISPEGRVTEYRPDKEGNIASKREYLGSIIDLSQRDPHTSPSLAEMTEWVAKEDPRQINLTEYGYNPRGQIIRTRKFANIDAKGNGIEDDQMGEEFTFPNLYGNWFTKQVKQDDKSIAITKRSLDDLQRVTSETDALNQTTTYQYIDDQSQLKITYPNGRIKIIQKDDKSKVLSIQETADNITRTTQYGRDTDGRVVKTTQPDGNAIYGFYDHQDRLGYTVTASGIVTEYDYDLKNRTTTQTQYEKRIDPQDLYLINPPPPGILPSASKLIQVLIPQIKNPAKDRTTYAFSDKSGRVRYSVDSGQHVTEYFYDQRNHKIIEITYDQPLTDQQLDQLKSGQEDIGLKPNFEKDSCTRTFYDKDGVIIAKQDAGGYITEYLRDNAGKVKQKIVYNTKAMIDLDIQDFNIIRPVVSDKDAHSHYFRNAQGKIIAALLPAEKQGEFYFTAYQYYPNGLKQQIHQFANKVYQISPIPPEADPDKDQITHYQYDLLNRSTKTDLPNQKEQIINYDITGNMILQKAKDLKNPDNIDPDHQRSTTANYDNWNQKIRETTVLGGEIAHVYDPQSGLKIHTIDALGRKAVYFYDIEKRLVVTISPMGVVTQNILNTYGEIIQTTKYNNKISLDKIPEGGYLTDDIQKLFVPDVDHDEVILLERDKRGLITQKTDQEGCISTYQYNGLKKVIQEKLPVESQAPTLTKDHAYDARGLETMTTVHVDHAEPQITVYQHENPYGKETLRLNPLSGCHHTEYNCQGLVSQKTKNDGAINSSHQFTHTAFGKLETETDSLGNTTTHDYDQTNRTHAISYSASGGIATKIITANIFDEKVSETDKLKNKDSDITQRWTYTDDGQIKSYTDALEESTNNQFDPMGQKTKSIDANKIETDFEYNNDGYLTSKIQDAAGLKLQTQYERDSFGNAVVVTDPRKIVTQNKFDRKSQLIQSIQDMGNDKNLNLTTQKSYNSQGNLTSLRKGDLKNPNQYKETYQVDGFNRNTGKAIDPNGLNITTQQKLDVAGDVIAETDANGNMTRKFYNTLGLLRFTVDPEGGVSEITYDTEFRVKYTRIYERRVETQNIASLQDCLMIAVTDPQDTLLYHFYDTDGKERFQVNSLGSVGERQYDQARREIKTIKYDAQIDPKLLSILTTQQLVELMPTKANPDKDRVIYKIPDAKKQERFVIDGEKFISEKRFDANGNVIAKITYATKLIDPEKIAQLPPDQVLANIVLDPINDRSVFQVFDSCNNPEYIVDGEGIVTQFWHDENNNLIQTCVYDQKITVPESYDNLKALLKTLIPNPKIDCVKKSQFDNANRKIAETDPLDYIDKFQKDALGNTIIHTDRMNNNWLYHYDGAERLDTETMPPLVVVTVQEKLVQNKMRLIPTQSLQVIQDSKVHDHNGNELKIIKASNTEQARTLNCTYNKNNQLIGTNISNVLIDDNTKPGSFTTPPVKTTEINTRIIYNPKKLKVCEQNEAGQWSFTVYNSEGKPVYEVNAQGIVKQSVRNAFGEIIGEIVYDKKINLDLSQYTQTGIPLNVIEKPGVIIPNKTEDRTKSYDRDNRGDVVVTTMGPTFYYIPDADGTGKPQYALDYSKTYQQYNAFRQVFCKSELLDPEGVIPDSQQLYWFDRNGKTIAECDPVFRVIRRTYNSLGHEIVHAEWALKPKVDPTPATTLADLDNNYVPSPKDRTYLCQYDQAGNCTAKTTKQVVLQQISYDKDNVPSMSDLPAQDLTQHYQYNAIQKRTVVVYEDGNIAYTYYDARGLQVAVTDVPREDLDKKQIIPLTYFRSDYFGQRIITTRYKQGTAQASLDQFPVPIAYDPDDQSDIESFDNRGLVKYKQNAEGDTQGFGFTSVRKVARQYYYLTNKGTGTAVVHIDEKRFVFDELNRPVVQSTWRDNKCVQTTATQYNSFNNPIAEGPGDNTWPLYREFDSLNNCWKTNAKGGVDTITLRNLAGQETVTFQSASKDLSLVDYTESVELQLDDILSWDSTDLERTETQRDNAGRKIVTTNPKYSQRDPKDPANVPLNIITSQAYPDFGKTSLTWVKPQESNYTVKMTIWPMMAPDQKTELPIKTLKNRCGVDVSALDTDVYTYEMDYLFTSPITGKMEEAPRYRTQGDVQIDTGNCTKSLMLVVEVEKDNYTLNLTGNTEGVTAIQLYEGDEKVGKEIPVQRQDGKCTVNLKDQYSGVYTLVPIVGDKEKNPGSLSFTIYTPMPAKGPLSKQFEVSFEFKYYNGTVEGVAYLEAGELIWNVPQQYQQFPIVFTCTFIDYHYQLITLQDTIIPGKYYNTYYDNAGQVLHENTLMFTHPNNPYKGYYVREVEYISLALQLNATDQLVVADRIRPSSVRGDGQLIIEDNKFLPTSILYVSPLTGFSKPPVLYYLDVTMDRLATWKKLPVAGMDANGVYINVTNLEPCIYPFKIFGEISFWEDSRKIPALNARLPQNEFPVKFKTAVPHKEEGVSFNLLKTDKKSITDLLESQKGNEKIRQQLAPEIFRALMMGTFTLDDNQWKGLKKLYEENLKAYKSLVAFHERRKITHNSEYDAAYLNQEKARLVDVVQKDILDYCAKSKIFQNYSNHLKDKGEMGYQTALLYAKQAGVSLYLWEKDPEHKDALRLVDFYDAGKNASAVFHLETAGSIMTNVLLPEGTSQEDIYGEDQHWSFTVNPADGSPYPSNQAPPSHPVEILPSYYYEYDAWNNLIKMTDTLGNVTEKEYGHDNQPRVVTQPQVYIMDENNKITYDNPVIHTGYNQRGHKIGTTDANGNTQAIVLDAANQEVGRRVGDGLLVRLQWFNALGQREKHEGARPGYFWKYQYNHLNAILQITYPSGLTKRYVYNELNHRTQDIDQSGLITSYDYNALDDVVTRYSPSGLQTVMVFDHQHQMIEMTNPDGTKMTWDRDYFSIELHHVDIGGVLYTSWRDFKQQITRRFSNAARMNYAGAAADLSMVFQGKPVYCASTWPIPTTDLSFQYDAGRMWLVLDASGNNTTEYEYDSENRETALYSGGQIIHSNIDALGEIVYTYNSGATTSIVCDANRNRRHVVVNCVQTKDIWYSYDKANRVIYDGYTGLTLIYQAGFRAQQNKGGNIDAVYVYDKDGILTDANYYQLPGVPGEVATHRKFTPNGKLLNYTESGPYSYEHNIYYTDDKNQWVQEDYQGLDGAPLSTTTYSNFSPMGLPGHQHTDYKDGISDDMNNAYGAGYEDLKLTSVSGTRTDKYGPGKASTATKSYGPNGVVSIMTGLQDGADPSSTAITTKYFGSTFDGKLLWRETATGIPSKVVPLPDFYDGTVTRSWNYYDTHGNLIATWGTDPANPDQYSMTLNYMQHVSNSFGSQFKMPNVGNGWFNKLIKEAEEKAKAQFQKQESQKVKDFEAAAHAPHLSLPDFTQTFPAQAPEKYTVAAGDSCTSIAQRLYGDAGFDAAIAAANGVSVDEPLFIGQILDLPQYQNNTNNMDNNTPYEKFMSIMIGNLYPHLDLKQPPPPKKHHSGGWLGGIVGDVVHAIVDVAACIVGGIVGGPLGAAVFEAFADAAFQEVATGSIDWKMAAVAGIEGGIGFGITSAVSGVAISASQLAANVGSMTLQQTMETAGAIAVSDQLVEMAAGLRTKFDFEAVLTQIGSAVIMHGVTPVEDSALSVNAKSFTGSVINSETGGLVGSGLEAAEGQKVDISAMAAQALGSAVGSEIGGEVKAEIQSKKTETANAYNQAKRESVGLQQAQGQNSLNPGRNRNGMFAGFNQNNNQVNNSKPQNPDHSSWLMEDPKKRLEDAGVDLSDNNGNDSLVDSAHKGLGIGAVGAGVGEYSKVMGNQWKAPNGTWFNRASSDELATMNEVKAIDSAKIFHAAGKFMFRFDAGISTYNAMEDINEGHYLDAAKEGLDIGMSAIGLMNPLGFAASTAYFVVDQFIGWNNVNTAMEEANSVDEFNQEVTGAGIWERAKFQ